MLISKLRMYGAAVFDAFYRFGFLLQVTFLFFVDSVSVGLFFVVNASIIVGKSISNLGFSRARYQRLILASEKVMQQSLKVLIYRQVILLVPALAVGFILLYLYQSDLILTEA